jgi:hypothetical protein
MIDLRNLNKLFEPVIYVPSLGFLATGFGFDGSNWNLATLVTDPILYMYRYRTVPIVCGTRTDPEPAFYTKVRIRIRISRLGIE